MVRSYLWCRALRQIFIGKVTAGLLLRISVIASLHVTMQVKSLVKELYLGLQVSSNLDSRVLVSSTLCNIKTQNNLLKSGINKRGKRKKKSLWDQGWFSSNRKVVYSSWSECSITLTCKEIWTRDSVFIYLIGPFSAGPKWRYFSRIAL